MIRNFIFILAIFGLFSCNENNQILYPIQENGLFGFIDSAGNKIIEPQYLYVSKFNEGLAVAVVDTIFQTISSSDTFLLKFGLKPFEIRNVILKYGFINHENKFVLPPIYTYTSNINDIDFNNIGMGGFMFYNGLAVLQDNKSKKYGYINHQGDTVIKCDYKEVFHFSEGKAAVQKDFKQRNPNEKHILDKQALKWGYIDNKGEVVIDFQYFKAYPHVNGIARTMVSTSDISKEDEEIDGEITKNKNGTMEIDHSKKHKTEKGNETWSWSWLLIDSRGHVIKTIDAMMYTVYDFSRDSIAVLGPTKLSEMFNIGYSFVNRKGEKLKPLGDLNKNQIDSISKTENYIGYITDDITMLDVTLFSNGYAGVKLIDKTWYFIDKYLIAKSHKSYQQILPFTNSLAAVKEENKWGFVNDDLELVIPCQFDSCESFWKNLAKVYTLNGGLRIESYINKKGETVWQKMENNDILSINNYNNKYSNKNKAEFGKWRTDLVFSSKHKSNNIFWIVICMIPLIVSVLIFYFYIRSLQNKKRYLYYSNLMNSLDNEINKNGFNDRIKGLISEIEQIKKIANLNYDWSSFELLKEKAEINKSRKIKAVEDKLLRLESKIKDGNINGINGIIKELKQDISNPLFEGFKSLFEDSKIKISIIEEQKKVEQLNKKITNYKKEIDKNDIDSANEIEAEITSKINDKIYLSIKPKFDVIKHEFDEKKRNGILISEDELYVKYDTPSAFVQEDNLEYAVSKFPLKGCVVWPYRRGIIARRGYKEEFFETELKKHLSSQVSVLGDVNLLPQDGCRPYEPDIAIIDNSSLNIRIDIEIDEPYAGLSRIPTHYIGCGDELRDCNINNLGWIVIRFAEIQIQTEPIKCISYIANILNTLNPKYEIPDSLKNISIPTKIKQWSQLDAQKMAANKIRENYLKIDEFGSVDKNIYKSADLTLTDFEKKLAKKVQGVSVISSVNQEVLDGYNLKNIHKNDTSILFDPVKHLYTFNGFKLHSVSEIISNFFPLFDNEYWSEKKSRERGVPQLQIKEEWDCKGAMSRDTGTHLHKQIENYFLGLEIEQNFIFKYHGQYIKESNIISIDKELKHLNQFIADYNIIPYRTEWRIFDKKNMIAGTIDFIYQNGEKYDIYDWKRSEKIFKDNPYQSGYGKLSHLQDTSFNHYCLQQNLYKYILEKNYGIKIGKMNLVVLHQNYDKYKVVSIPELTNEIHYILDNLN